MSFKIRTDSSSSSWTDIFHRFKRFDAQLEVKYIICAVKKWGEEFRRTLTNSWNSESTNKSINKQNPFSLYRREQVINRFFFVSFDEE